MAISEPYELDGVTVGTSELSIVSGTTSLQTITDDGEYQLWVDAGAMAKGDEFRIKGYEKVEGTGGTKKVFFQQTLLGVQTENFVSPMFLLVNGWDFTITKIAGTDRAFDASIRKIDHSKVDVDTIKTQSVTCSAGVTVNAVVGTATAGSTATAVSSIATGVSDLQSRTPAALVGGRMDANVGAISADATAADNAEAFFDGTGYAGTGNVIPTVTTVTTTTNLTNLPAITAGWLTAAGIATDAFTAAKFAAASLNGKGDWNVGKTGYTLTATTGLGNQTADITGTITTVTTLTGHTPQTGDSYAIVNSSAHGNAAIKGYVDDIGTAGAGLTAIPWNAAWDAEVQSEVDDGLIAKGLDHLVFTSVVGTDIADNSIVAYLASKSATADWDSYVNTTDSLEAARDNIGTAGAGISSLAWNAAWDAEVQSEVQDAIEVNNLDHLLKVAAVAGDAVDSSIIARLASKSATPAFSSFVNTTDSLEAIRDNQTTAVGSGAVSVTYTVNDQSSNPIDGVEVWLTTDSAGSNVVAGTLNTNALGQVSFMLDVGTYYLWRQHGGYDFTNPTTTVVTA